MSLTKKYDYLCVGAGLFNSVFARSMKDAGKKVLILEKRNHIGGNCFSENIEGIDVHKYGPHILHTNNKEVWEFIQRFTEINRFTYRPKVCYEGKYYSFPINLMTFNQIWGIKAPKEAREKIEAEKVDLGSKNLEDWCLSQIGRELYSIFVYGYTLKQWGREPKDLPASIIKRIPVRFSYNDDYFNDAYEGIPSNGYGKLFENLLKGIRVITNCNYFDNKKYWNSTAKKIIYTGKIDEYFNYALGELPYRSLRFETSIEQTDDYQGNAAINYTGHTIPYTRIIEHKHFNPYISYTNNVTVITKEFPLEWRRDLEAYYPIRDKKDRSLLFERYQEMAKKEKMVFFKGRLGEYVYQDMCPTILNAINFAKKMK